MSAASLAAVGSEPAEGRSDAAKASQLSPREIVAELDRYIIGQHEAKRAVAIALAADDDVLPDFTPARVAVDDLA